MVYQPWFDQYGGLPANWIKIGEWTITDFNVVCGSITVDFFVLSGEDVISLKDKFKEFSILLPKSVTYKVF